MTYDHWKSTNPADEFLGPEAEEHAYPDTASPRLVEYARRAAIQDNVREAIRLQALANEMHDLLIEGWPLPVDTRWHLSLVHSMVSNRAARLMDSRNDD